MKIYGDDRDRKRDQQRQNVPNTPSPDRQDSSANRDATINRTEYRQRELLSGQPDFDSLISAIRRSDIESSQIRIAQFPSATHEFDKGCELFWPDTGDPYGLAVMRVRGLSRIPEADNEKNKEFENRASYVLSGIYEQPVTFIYILFGQGPDIRLYAGVKAFGPSTSAIVQQVKLSFEALKTCLVSSYPDIVLEDLNTEAEYGEITEKLGRYRAAASVIGNPSPERSSAADRSATDRLIRALSGSDYCYYVEGNPIDKHVIIDSIRNLSVQIADVHKHTKRTSGGKTSSKSEESHEEIDRLAVHYEEILEIARKKADSGYREGMWRVGVTLLTSSEADLRRAASLLRAVFAGENSNPEPIRIVFHSRPAQVVSAIEHIRQPVSGDRVSNETGFATNCLETALPSSDFGMFVDMPAREVPGFRVTSPREFALDIDENLEKPVSIGTVLSPAGPTNSEFTIPLEDFDRHCLIVGATGSGKTNTSFNILYQIYCKYKIPFLVIEPAKAEYRNMLNAEGMKDLQIFAPGYKDIAPFRINPFEFPTGIDPQQHISNLYTVFNAAFILYAPMPYVLERALYEVYEDRGWDLGAGVHPDYDFSKKCVPSLAFPTLTDLYFKIGEVVDRLGYDQRIRMDVTAGLQARVDSLRVGQKGRTFDVRRSVPFDSLLEKPTILEVSHIGSDDEKAFLIGLVLMRLYEERELGGESANLKHVTVIEEAHRLLTKTSTDTSSAEEANMKGKSVETFCNILSEIRAYGEGIMVAEQIPAKLAQDVLKNTNLKIMHRVVAADDRELMGMMMNLGEKQQFAITSLKRGEAAAFAEGLETPALVKVPLVKIAKKASDADVKKASDAYYSRFPSVNRQTAGCVYCKDICRFGARSKRLIGNSSKTVIWGRALASLGALNPELTDWNALSDSILPPSIRTNLPAKQKDDMSWCFIAIASEIAFWDLRNYKNIDIATIEDLTNSFVHFMSYIRDRKPPNEISIRHADFRQRLIRVMGDKKGPLRGCAVCRNICLYRPLAGLLVNRPDILSGFNKAISSKEKKKPTREYCEKVCARELGTGQSDIVKGAAICFFAHVAEMVNAKNPAKDIKYVFDQTDS